MRLHSLAFLGFLILCSTLLLMNTDRAHAQANLVTTSRIDLAKAFQSIQTAEQQGTTKADLEPLIVQLNRALLLEENATTYQQQNDTNRANSYALQSINLSTSITLQAQTLGNQAQTATQNRTVLEFGLAILAAVLVAAALLQAPSLGRALQRRRLRKTGIEYGSDPSAR